MPVALADAYLFLSDPSKVAAIAALVLALAILFFLHERKPWLSRIQRKPLLTGNENEFFHRLQRALPAYQVFPQVSFAAFLTDDGKLARNARWSLRARLTARSPITSSVSGAASPSWH